MCSLIALAMLSTPSTLRWFNHPNPRSACRSACVCLQGSPAEQQYSLQLQSSNTLFLLQASLIAALQPRPPQAATEDPVAGPDSSPSSSGPHQPTAAGVQCLWPATIKDLRLPPYSLRSPEPWQSSTPSGSRQVKEGESDVCSSSSISGNGGGSGSELATIVFQVSTCSGLGTCAAAFSACQAPCLHWVMVGKASN